MLPELLSPAGTAESLRAAVCSGADAVYLGYKTFGARASVGFDDEALARACDYAHLYHVRVHVTVNTLIKQRELAQAEQALRVIAACGADAIIVQDLGVAELAKQVAPSLELHASTQMAIHTAAGAMWAHDMGFRRVVLARECSRKTVADVSATGIQTEIFAHGALCAGVSGQCLMSSMAGGRSGNRGRCAQPCRQIVRLGDDAAALLSMKDLCLRDDLDEVIRAGVSSLKIEGRLKSPEYVAVVTEAYRKALDAYAAGRFEPADECERTALMQVFHRGGFTRGHLMGAEDADLCSVERVNHGGVPMGEIIAVRGGLATLRLSRTLHDGDSLRVNGERDVELRYSGREQEREAVLRIREGEHVQRGQTVDRLADAVQLEAARAIAEPKLPLALHAVVRANQPMTLTASDGETTVSVQGESAQTPLKRALSVEDIQKQLAKVGDSPFALSQPATVETDAAFAPVAALNALRRQALTLLERERRDAFAPKRPLREEPIAPPVLPNREQSVKMLAVRFTDAAIGQDLQSAGANCLIYEPTDWTTEALEASLDRLPNGAWVALPPQMSDCAWQKARPLLEARAERLAGLVLGSVGQLGFECKLPIAFGSGVPIINRWAAKALLTERVRFCTLWSECTADELAELGLSFPCLLSVYGRERVMLLNHCPERVARGLAKGHAQCRLCQAGDRACARPDAELIDRRGFHFPLTRTRFDEGCVVNVWNALPTELSAFESRRKALGAGMLLSFTVESAEEQRSLTRRFAALLQGEAVPPIAAETTNGHFLRGVE